MARKAGIPWAATSVPVIRDQWCAILGGLLDEVPSRIAAARAAGNDAVADRWAAAVPDAAVDLADLAGAQLFWVARDMVDLAVSASQTLPEWSPSVAMPAASGLVCLAKPAGRFRWPVPGTGEFAVMPVDAMSWGVRGASVGVTVAFRWDRVGDQLASILPRQPLVQHPIGLWNLDAPVASRADDGGLAALSVLGAAWLLMQQVRVVETRTITTTAYGGNGGLVDGSPSTVSLIEVRRAAGPQRDAADGGGPGRRYSKKFWVEGHWRQQACGANRALRKPVWISPYVKGPDDAPMSTRVTVWRR